jgi:hypothetical protein
LESIEESFDFGALALNDQLNPSVTQVSNKAGHLKLAGNRSSRVAEADSLNVA